VFFWEIFVILVNLRGPTFVKPSLPTNPETLPMEFGTRLIASQGALYGFIASLMGRLDSANDVLQETNLKLCRKAAEYDPEQPFLRWAFAFAKHEVMAWRTRQARSHLIFDDELVEQIAGCFDTAEMTSERELIALEQCVEKLPPRQRELVAARYGAGEAVQDIAARLHLSENAAAALFYRLRKGLADCMTSTLGGEAVS
jgi:RNA polymerase sigma-70 factor (ECF subfamily)